MSSSIRLQLRTLANHLPSLSHQSGNILLLLPILVFLSLYLYNAHLAGRIKTKEGYEQVVWPGQFGFPQWYGDPRGRELVPWVDETQEEGKQPVRLLGILPSRFAQHEQAVFLHHLADLGASVGLDVTSKTRDELQGDKQCWDWVWTFGVDALGQSHVWPEGCNPLVINEPDLKAEGVDLAAETTSNITLLTQAQTSHIRKVLKNLYADSHQHTNNPPPLLGADSVGLVHQSMPSADPYTFFPEKTVTGWKRKRVTLFVREKEQRRLTAQLGRREMLRDYLPSGWSVFFETDPLRPARRWYSPLRWQPFQPLNDWPAVISQSKKYDSLLARTMRESGVCVFFDEWEEGIVSYRMVQAMLSGCVVATVTPSSYNKPISKFIIPLDPLKSSFATPRRHADTTDDKDYVRNEFLPLLDQISGIISAYTSSSHTEAAAGGGTLDEKALWAFMYARERFTTRAKAREVRRVVEAYQGGGRGLELPGGYQDVY